MWFYWKKKAAADDPTELGYDPDSKVTLTIGEFVNALSEALKVVESASPATGAEQQPYPKWKRGDRAFVEVEVTGEQGGHTNFVLADAKHVSLTLPATALQEIV